MMRKKEFIHRIDSMPFSLDVNDDSVYGERVREISHVSDSRNEREVTCVGTLRNGVETRSLWIVKRSGRKGRGRMAITGRETGTNREVNSENKHR